MPMSPRLLRPRASGSNIGLQEAADWQARVVANGGTVSAATLAAVQQFCLAIHAAGIRDRFYRLNLFCGDSDINLSAVRTPLYRGQSLAGTQFGNTIDANNNFVQGDYAETGASAGLLGNGASKWLNTGLAQNFADNRHQAVVLQTNQTVGSQYLSGALQSGGANALFGIFSQVNTALAYNANDAGTISQTNAGTLVPRRSVITVSDPSGDGLSIYMNGQRVSGTATAYTTTSAASFGIFAANRSGSAINWTSARLAGYSLGLSLSASQVASLNSSLAAFSIAMGRE